MPRPERVRVGATLWLWIWFAASAGAAEAGRPAARAQQARPLRAAVDAIVDAPRFAAATWGIEVRDLDTGVVVYSRGAQKALKPASTLKLVATAAALDAFAEKAQLRTTLQTAAPLEADGRLAGDLFLVGAGDPNLAGRWQAGRLRNPLTAPGPAFTGFADALAAAGVRQISGRLIGHEGLWSGDRRGADWTWEDLVWSYGAEVSALSYNDNCADLVVAPGDSVGDPVRVERTPVSGYYSVRSSALTAPRGSDAKLTLERAAGGNVIVLGGALPQGAAASEMKVALEDPARYSVSVLQEVLAGRGISVTGGVATTSAPLPAGARVLATHHSAPLGEIVMAVNKQSQNLHAETLLRLLAAPPADGSATAGLAAEQEFLRRQHVRADDWALQDGSGLSRSDLVTARGLVDLLAAMDRHPQARAYRESLPVAGHDGTLERRMQGTPAESRVIAKTGSIRHVNALAGYATTRTGQRLAFAILVNHHTGESREVVSAIDAICNRLVAGR